MLMLGITSRVAGQAKKFSSEIAGCVKRGNLSVPHKAKKQLDEMPVAARNITKPAWARTAHSLRFSCADTAAWDHTARAEVTSAASKSTSARM
jgi:hypothetical protein